MASEYFWEDDRAQAMNDDYEKSLVTRAKDGDSEAWSEIFSICHPKIFRYLLGRTGNREVAEDLASAVFLEAVRRIRSFSPRGNKPLLAWLYGIARNLANYHHRTHYRRSDVQRENVEALRSLTPSLESDDPALKLDDWDLYAAVHQLSDDQREVVVLRFFAGLTTPEVARLVGKRERAVYSLYTRALRAMQKHLTDHDPGE